MSAADSKLQISFSLGRNKTVYVVGDYDQTQTTPEDRLEYWGIVQQFGQELSNLLVRRYNVGLRKIVFCEVDTGHIMFEVETDASAALRRKAIEDVQQQFVEEEPLVTYPMNGPEEPQ
jgi:hypothetical protein